MVIVEVCHKAFMYFFHIQHQHEEDKRPVECASRDATLSCHTGFD